MSENETYSMQCFECNGWFEVTAGRLRTQDFAPCPLCPNGGADLIHARQHGDN